MLFRSRRTYRIMDNAGNALEIVMSVERDGRELHATLVTLRYGGGENQSAPENDLAFEWALAPDGTLRSLQQRVVTGSGSARQEIEARFDAHSDTTDIKTKRSATERDVSRDGLVLIRLQTERGSLIATVPVLAVSLASPQLME